MGTMLSLETTWSRLRNNFKQAMPSAKFSSIRVVRDTQDLVEMSRGEVRSVDRTDDFGAMVLVHDKGGIGYAATPDLSVSGLRAAFAEASQWAHRCASVTVTNFSRLDMPRSSGSFETAAAKPWQSLSLKDKIEALERWSGILRCDQRIIDWYANVVSATRE